MKYGVVQLPPERSRWVHWICWDCWRGREHNGIPPKHTEASGVRRVRCCECKREVGFWIETRRRPEWPLRCGGEHRMSD